MRVGTTVSSRGAALLLVVLIVSIGLGPRFRLGTLDAARAIDVRPQDLLLPVAALVAYASVRATDRPGRRQPWWRWFVIACYSAVLVTLVHLLVDEDVGTVRRLAFVGRHLLLFALAAVVYGLYRRAGRNAGTLALRSLVAVVAANALWVAYQVVTGQATVLIGRTVGDQVGSYGPRLIGEPSSAGTGTFFAFAAALALAAYRAKLMRAVTAVPLFFTAAACAYVAESRTALVSVVCLVGLFVVQSGRGRASLPSRVALVTAVGSLAVWYVVRHHTERLSAAGLNRGAEDRLREIWGPIVDRAADDPLLLMLGVGPGGLPDPALPITEAHNVVLRAWLDFGLLGGTLFLAALAVAGVSAYRVSRDPGSEPFPRLFAELTALYGVAVAITGVALDSLTTVTSTHLLMLAVGLFAGASAAPAAPGGVGPAPNRSPAATAMTGR
jgi:O-antigen ligase